MEKHILRASENEVLMRMLRNGKNKVGAGWRQLRVKYLHNYYYSTNIALTQSGEPHGNALNKSKSGT
jgi:hypothetical protein